MGKVVLVTGAARRLGRAIALTLARAGWDVAVHAHRSLTDADQTVSDLQACGVRAARFVADLDHEAECLALLPAVCAHFGGVDAVVNNASLFAHDDLASFDFECLQSHLRVNVGAPVLLARALHQHLSERDASGCVVNLIDQKLWNLNPDHLSYTLSKAALEAANTALAMALAPRVRVCGVAPGVTLPSGPMSAAQFAQAHAMTPLGRGSSADDIAAAVAYLLNAQAVTGTTLLVDGGQHLQRQARDVLFLADPTLTDRP